MMRASKFAAFTVLLLCACQQSAAPQPEYRPGESGTVDHALCLLGFEAVSLREVTTGHHLVDATINGRSGRFVVDTGANVTVVDKRHAGAFGLTDDSGAFGGVVGGITGGQNAEQVSVDDFQIGPVPLRQERVVTADLGSLLQMLGRVSGGTVHGLIGQDVLKEHRAIVDVARPMLYLIVEDQEPGPVPAGECQTTDDPPRTMNEDVVQSP